MLAPGRAWPCSFPQIYKFAHLTTKASSTQHLAKVLLLAPLTYEFMFGPHTMRVRCSSKWGGRPEVEGPSSGLAPSFAAPFFFLLFVEAFTMLVRVE